MGKIHKFTDKTGLGLYPVTVSDAVVVGNKKLTDKVSDIDSSINTVDAKFGGYKINVSSTPISEAKTINFVI